MTASFPSLPGITYPVKRSPSGKMARHESVGGKRTALPLRATPRWRWEVPIEFMRAAAFYSGSYTEFETFVAFFNTSITSGAAFAFTDPDDHVATNQSFGAGDGSTVSFQLTRGLGGFVEPVYLPTITTIYVAGVATPAYTVNRTGVVTFTTAPAGGAALTWTGTFAWMCRFAVDSADISRIMAGLYEAKSIPFENEISP